MEGRGKYAVVAMLTVGLVFASFGWWWNLQRSKRTLEFWGPEAAQIIRQGPKVTALRLTDDATSSIVLDVTKLPNSLVSEQKEISTVPGLLHARNSLLDDASFAWETPPPNEPRWTHALQFENAQQLRVTILFDLEQSCLRFVESPSDRNVLPFVPKSKQAWRTAFGARYFKDPELLPEGL